LLISHAFFEPQPVKRTVKKYKVFPAGSQVLLAAFMRRGKACAFPSASGYVTGEGLALTESSDRFMYTTETRTKIKSDSSDGGGGGSTSSCSGGGGHGRSGSF